MAMKRFTLLYFIKKINYQENINLRKIHFIKNENKNEKD